MINTLMQIATQLERQGLYEQAFAALEKALRQLHPKEAPARAAVLFSTLAKVFLETDDPVAAQSWFAKAATIQTLLAQTPEHAISVLGHIEASYKFDKPESLIAQLDGLVGLQMSYKPRAIMLRVRLLASSGELSAAEMHLMALKNQVLSQGDSNQLAIVQSELAIAQGDLVKANAVLSARIDKLAHDADAAPTAAMAYLTVRSGERVRRAWVDLQDADSDAKTVYRTAMLANPARFMTPVKKGNELIETRKLLPGELGFLTALNSHTDVAPARLQARGYLTLANLQKMLPSNAQALAIIPGNKHSLALWVNADALRLQRLSRRSVLDARAKRLNALLSKPTTSNTEVDVAARALSDTLFAGRALLPPPVLWVVADEYAASVPFSVLPWLGQSRPLLHTTDVSLLTGLRESGVNAEVVGTEVNLAKAPGQGMDYGELIFFAPSYAGRETKRLDFVRVEQERISQVLDVPIRAITGNHSTRERLRELLGTSGHWLHISAHGKANPGVLGNAGLWLPENGRDDFFSWMDLGSLRTQLDLLLLNACESGSGALPSRQANVSFAIAMSASGSNHVVASLWPVSDTAAGTWIPAFYSSLIQINSAKSNSVFPKNSAAGAASALRVAQNALEQSPHYRHPFYWGALVHFKNL